MSERTLRGRLAVASGRLAGHASRMLGRGSGGMIGGKVALSAHPEVLKELCADRKVVLVTGTNGKSTTNKMVRAALGGESVASNVRGDNMPPGIVTALMNHPHSAYAAIEVDEMHLPAVAAEAKPAAIVLLNLSRDQLDRVGEIGTVEKRLRQAVEENPQAVVIANCDDPLITSAAWDAPNSVWVAAGSGWGADSASFPRGGGRVLREGTEWHVEGQPQFRRPSPTWWIEGTELVGPQGRYPLNLKLPGTVNLSNAAQAIACAVALGVDVEEAVAAVENVGEVAGRYQRFDVEGRRIRLLLAKNPAGWQEALTMVDPHTESIVIGVNGQIPDGEDLSWLWDVDFEGWGRTHATASGERGADLAVRLDYAEIDAPLIDEPLDAILAQEEGDVDVLLNYTAFRDLLSQLRAAGYQEVAGE
ncbi:DUF1727 domain-containing protein [Actinomycetaceae bacterium WB03_NA08]|uniref:Lipid II isoglutaminyl synthase (glutamine-hydrolyzing) subunit MurT n=1 Tax=Scrofimicrobium canadense TaxID=2652290 RepID=A0A6N7VR81_9ACTO|nr:MurT ligase domain-containing protein [Scrofimicrobium canadense]MSS84257.1 DUF1727 domain-containing protein [Scrofimicrobium canadense]